MASLDLTTADDNLVQVMLCYDDRNYLLCSLKKNSTWQVPLDLNFEEGTKIAFTCNGHGHVHLTGYLIPDEDLDLDELEEEEDDDDDDEVPQLVDKQLKRKAKDLKSKKKIKRPKQEIEAESSDEDIELDGTNEENDSEDSSDEYQATMLNQEDDDDDDEDDEEDEEDEDDEEDKKVVKSQQKDKKSKQQQQQKKKEDKKKLVNGKELKQDQQTKQKKNKDQSSDQNVQSDQKKRVVEGGVVVEELKIGNGTPAKSGKFVSVYYVGRLKNGRKFDSTTQGEGFKFRLGKGEVIKGWDVGIIGMKVGGKRRITVPPAMGYGARGSPPVIPSNSTLIFEVELRNVH